MDPLTTISTRRTPQAEQADARQVPNAAGGYGFTVGRLARLHRFLTLGTDGGTYYASERELTKANAAVVLDWARADAAGLVAEIVAVSQAGRALRNNPALFALAAAAGLGDLQGRRAAFAALPLVARTGTHLYLFTGYVQQFRGWGRGLRRAVASWYEGQDPAVLAYQVLKYRQREGWTHRDLLRLAHPAHRPLLRYAAGKDVPMGDLPPLVEAFTKAQAATTVRQWVSILVAHPGLSWEMLPDAALTERAVWAQLLVNGLPMTALMRQLPRLTRLGVVAPMSAGARLAADQLASAERLARARVHPVSVLIALRTYVAGHSRKGTTTWEPVAQITDALDAAFYAAFGAVEPAGKRTMLALDVSGSMYDPTFTKGHEGLFERTGLTPAEIAGALSMVTAATEPACLVTAFSYPSIAAVPVSPRQRLDGVLDSIRSVAGGGTDCALPMLWAAEHGVAVDTFQIYTDNETWAGDIHPHQALERYRQKTGIAARLAVVGMTATDVTIADPADPGSLDVAGFDSAVPGLLADFARGDV